MKKELTRAQYAQRSILKKYRKELWNPFVGAVKKYELIQSGDKIAVCISGGKDSMLMAMLIKQLQKISEVPFDAEYIVMDPGYNPQNRAKIEENAKILEIPIKIFETDIFGVVDKIEKNPCYLCARMRRGHLYSMAKKLGCNKIALGHHLNDVIETTVMGMFYGAQIQGMMPKLHSTNFEGMELIRPLYKVKEKDIIAFSNYNGLKFLQCACKFTENSAHNEGLSKRKEIKALIEDIKKVNPNVDDNIFRSIHNVNMATIPGWRDRDSGTLHSFTENY